MSTRVSPILPSAPAPPHAAPLTVHHQPGHGPMLQMLSVREFAHHRLTVSSPAFPAGLAGVRIVHLSDMHFRGQWFPAYDRLINQLREDPPDLVLLTGDFVDDKYDPRPTWPLVERLISSLTARTGLFAVHGNHDGDLLVPHLAGLGVRIITNRRQLVRVNGATVELIGLCGVHRNDWNAELVATLPPKTAGVPRIVLSHFPDLIHPARDLEPDLYLAGHTHGGQICLPGPIPIITHDSLPRRMAGGVHRIGGTWMIINRGTGFSSHPVRLFCPAEYIDITLQQKT